MGKHRWEEGPTESGRHAADRIDAVPVAELLEQAIHEGHPIRYDWGSQDPAGLVEDTENTAPIYRPDLPFWFEQE
jgi:hypothetical protein